MAPSNVSVTAKAVTLAAAALLQQRRQRRRLRATQECGSRLRRVGALPRRRTEVHDISTKLAKDVSKTRFISINNLIILIYPTNSLWIRTEHGYCDPLTAHCGLRGDGRLRRRELLRSLSTLGADDASDAPD